MWEIMSSKANFSIGNDPSVSFADSSPYAVEPLDCANLGESAEFAPHLLASPHWGKWRAAPIGGGLLRESPLQSWRFAARQLPRRGRQDAAAQRFTTSSLSR